MTDAERWRKIAETKAWGEWGLCHALRYLGQRSESLYVNTPQTRRMWRALQVFDPATDSCYWWPTWGTGDTERTYAALLLAAMAEADGGNHREEPDT